MREETAVKPTPQPFAPAATGLLQRTCACGQHTTDQHGQCTECKKKGQLLQRRAVNQNGPEVAPPIVHEVLHSPGRPLDPATRAFIEPLFNHDFSGVRVHTDARAAESARAVNALAYTVGHHVAFDSGQYAPTTGAGRRLLAHELAHVVQQGNGATAVQCASFAISRPGDSGEREADRMADGAMGGARSGPRTPTGRAGVSAVLQRTIGDGHDLRAARFAGDPVLEACFDGERLLRFGSRGAAVEKLQQALIDAGFPLPVFGVDGIFESETQSAVRDFQRAHGLDPDGLVGPLTMGSLDALFAAPGPAPTPPGPGPGPGPGPTPGAGVSLRSIHFTSDHSLMKDNRLSWDDGGTRFAEPEWQASTPDGRSVPISHQKGQTIQAVVTLDVSAGLNTSLPFTLSGRSGENFLTFAAAGSLNSGENQVAVAASNALPDEIAAYPGTDIAWTIVVAGNRQFLGTSLAHEVFATFTTPDGGVTYRRLAKAVELTAGFGNDSHLIVSGQMKRFPFYNLKKPYRGNIWPLADDIASSAECQAIVRFVQAVNKMVGVPGNAVGISVYASPTAPETPLTGHLVESGGATGGMFLFPPQPVTGYEAALYDGADQANNYEAALEFDHGGQTLFYPGGVPGGVGLKAKEEVLHAFKKMAWGRWDPVGAQFVPVTLIHCYDPPC
jgi:peptidoglycan hydrolase-like protein with peptidoglycan-binding domain